MAAELFESVKVQAEHWHKPTLFPNTICTRIEDKYIKLFSTTFSVPG